MPKVALYGRPGAGKSTLAGLLAQELSLAGADVLALKMGAPLYELQAVVHAVAGCPLLNGTDQDGQLLNALGTHLRRINPSALTEAFTLRVRQAEDTRPDAVLVCDDLRAPDVQAVTDLGFVLVEVTAPDAVRLKRKRMRADLSSGDEHHPTEAPVTAAAWRRVDNAGSFDGLRERAAELAREVLR
ncbi:ATP-binding protein [Streptomyces sp. MI02-7b]|uniref:ATP-binding protein n=1 Tax=Streptomyces sp. MI02-7b TaxID=462941 RepID=UPI0029A59BAD|nr:ATP-binding protein [Streptomyces sp. MI02-7b]MDX3075843.1 ATP-binding protein [Streptomyces sp. MI02-7b]